MQRVSAQQEAIIN